MGVRNIFIASFLGMALVLPAHAAENKAMNAKVDAKSKKTEEKTAVVKDNGPAMEAMRRWKAVEAQETWVASLESKLNGEKDQLKQMQEALSRDFNLDAEKLQKGFYQYDEKAGKFTEKK